MATLEVRSLSRSFDGDTPALDEVSFTVEHGRVAAILGPSGCGKTTALRIIAGLETADAGTVTLDGRSLLDVPPHRRGIGLMFQDLALFPHLDVRSNVDFGLRMQGWPRDRREARAAELLDLVGLADRARSRVHELSGGEQQRVALARTLAPEPGVLLLDEPLGSLDEALKVSLRAELRRVLSELGITAILVSHDLRDAAAIADDLLVMERARVLQAGPLPEVVGQPVSAPVATMLGYRRLARGVVRAGTVEVDAGARLEVASELPDGARVEVFAHPSALSAHASSTEGLAAMVLARRADGPTHLLALDVGDSGEPLEAPWADEGAPPGAGDAVQLRPRAGTLRVYATGAGGVVDGAGDGRALGSEV